MPKPIDLPVKGGQSLPDDLIELGHIRAAYGIQGWLHIYPYTQDDSILLDVKDWWLKAPASLTGAGALPSLQYVRVQACRVHGSGLVAQLQGVHDRDEAERLRGWVVCVSRAQFPTPDQEEYYWVDLIGCRLYGEEDGRTVLLGEVTDVIDNGAHGVLRVVRTLESDEGGLIVQHDTKGRPIEILVPFVAAHVHTVDLAHKQLFSNWPSD